MLNKNYTLDICLLAIYIFFTFLFYILQGGFLNLIALYFLLLFVLKRIFYRFKISNVHYLKLNTIYNLFIWTLIFAGLSLPYFLLEDIYKVFYLNLYFVFMSIVGLNGFTILIFDLNLKDSLLKTYSKTKSKVFSLNFLLGLLVLNFLVFVDYSIDFLIMLPFLLYLVTKKYLNFF